MGLLDFLFRKQKRAIDDFKSRGAIILDVRSAEAYQKDHIIGSENVPMDQFQQKLSHLKACNKPFIVCCTTGINAAKTVKFLLLNGIEATQGGSYQTLKRLL